VVFNLGVVEAESYQLHYITPIGGAHAVTGAQNSVPSPLISPKKARPSKLKYEALEIRKVGAL